MLSEKPWIMTNDYSTQAGPKDWRFYLMAYGNKFIDGKIQKGNYQELC